MIDVYAVSNGIKRANTIEELERHALEKKGWVRTVDMANYVVVYL